MTCNKTGLQKDEKEPVFDRFKVVTMCNYFLVDEFNKQVLQNCIPIVRIADWFPVLDKNLLHLKPFLHQDLAGIDICVTVNTVTQIQIIFRLPSLMPLISVHNFGAKFVFQVKNDTFSWNNFLLTKSFHVLCISFIEFSFYSLNFLNS